MTGSHTGPGSVGWNGWRTYRLVCVQHVMTGSFWQAGNEKLASGRSFRILFGLWLFCCLCTVSGQRPQFFVSLKKWSRQPHCIPRQEDTMSYFNNQQHLIAINHSSLSPQGLSSGLSEYSNLLQAVQNPLLHQQALSLCPHDTITDLRPYYRTPGWRASQQAAVEKYVQPRRVHLSWHSSWTVATSLQLYWCTGGCFACDHGKHFWHPARDVMLTSKQ